MHRVADRVLFPSTHIPTKNVALVSWYRMTQEFLTSFSVLCECGRMLVSSVYRSSAVFAPSLSLAAPFGQDERVYDQTGLPAARAHPARPRYPQAAVLDPQDRSIPSAAVAAQMPKGRTKLRVSEGR